MRKLDDAKSLAIAKTIMSIEGPKIYALLAQATKLANGKQPFEEKAEALMNIATGLSDAVSKHTACKDQCSHCCYMATAISSWEANMISRYTGRPIVETAGVEAVYMHGARDVQVEKFAGEACTFLVEGKCSIYPVRPIACRTHHNLNDNADNCIITKDLAEEDRQTTPALNFNEFFAAHAWAFLKADNKFADIREFFPKEAA